MIAKLSHLCARLPIYAASTYTKGMISMSEPMKREVADMCEYTAAIAEKNRQKGREEGWAEGRAEEKLDAIQRLLRKGFDREMVISLGYSTEEYEKAEQRLSVQK